MHPRFSSFRCLVFRAPAIVLTATLMPLETLSQVVDKPAARHIIICYVTMKGDPLELLSIAQRNGADGFIKDEEWFALTRAGARPDVVRRIFEGATQGVLNRANVIVNLEDGYYTGSSLLDTFSILQATHGNIGQEQSYGFVMSTTGELPPYIHAADLWQALGSAQLQRKPQPQKSTKSTKQQSQKTGLLNEAFITCSRRGK